jgi:hypothetical protein
MTSLAREVREINHSISLDDARTDFVRYVRTLAVKDRLARDGYVETDAVQIAERVKGAGVSSRLRAMLEIPPGAFAEAKKQLELNAPADARQLQNRLFQKAPVAVGTIGNTSWAGALAPFQQASVAFLQSLSPFSAFDRILNDNGFTRLPLRTRIAIATASAIGYSVSEMQAKPVSAMTFNQASNPALKAVGEVCLSDELILMTTPAANALFESEMQRAVAKATDAAFVQIIVAGAGSTHASTGLTAAQFMADMTTALSAIAIDVNSRLYLVLPTNTYKIVSLLRDTGGTLLTNQTPSSGKLGAVTVIASSGATTTGVLFDASAVGGDSDIVTTAISRQAALELADNPTSGDFHLVSLFQNNLTVIRCERYFGAVVLRPNSLAAITGYS